MNKKKPNIFLRALNLLFIIFMGLFIANLSGYYESKVRANVIVTEEKIKEFESKVQSGDARDINHYLDNKREDYSNKMSKIGDNLTNSLEKFVNKSSKFITDILKSLF